MNLLEQIDQARARALLRHRGDGTGAAAPAPAPRPRPAPAVERLLRLPLLLFFVGLPAFAVLSLVGLDIEAPFYLYGKSMLLLSSIGFGLTALAAFGRLPARFARDWQPRRSSLPLRAALLALLWTSLVVEMPWLSLLTPILLARPIMRLTNATALRAMEERELLRLRAGLAPTPPISGQRPESGS